MNDIFTQVYLNILNKFFIPKYEVKGAILGCLGTDANEVKYKITELLPDDPWLAIILSDGPVTERELEKWHNLHNVDIDHKGIPYYFIVKDITTNELFIWYSDEENMLPINTPEEKENVIKIGLLKGLVEDQLDF